MRLLATYHFWAEKPNEVFEINVNLHILVSQTEQLVIPLCGYFFTDYKLEGMDYGPENATAYTSNYGHGQVAIGNNFCYSAPAQYDKWNNGFSYDLLIVERPRNNQPICQMMKLQPRSMSLNKTMRLID
jgi:hypothetical protein